GDWAIDSARARRSTALRRRSEWLDRYVGRLMRKTAELERRITELESEHAKVSEALEDPGFWATFERATNAAGLTGDDDRHEVLARAVIERLTALPNSTAAVASSHAVEVLSRLTTEHLNLLALVSIVVAVRPSLPDPEAVMRDGSAQAAADGGSSDSQNRREQAALREVVQQYADWLDSTFGALSIQAHPPSDIATAQLVAAAAIIFDRNDERDLLQTLMPWPEESRFFSYLA